MFEEFSFEALMERMLGRVSDSFDKREGSVIYDAIAPAAMELAEFYITLDMVMNETFAESASYYYLVKKAAERGILPKEETYAVGKMEVTPVDTAVPAGERFNLDTLNYSVAGPIEGEAGSYRIQCETAGTEGNQQIGALLPIEYIEGLESAELTEILIPGEDDEDVETFRERYFASFGQESFGGNKADYINKVNDMDGVGACKVIRMWKEGYAPSGFIPDAGVTAWVSGQSEQTIGAANYAWLKNIHHAASQKLLTAGGTVKVIIVTSEFKEPSDALINAVQEALDPANAPGEGDGLAPIGHVVNVTGVKGRTVDFSFNITFAPGYTFDSVKPSIEAAVDAYFQRLAREWAGYDKLTVRVSQIESSLLGIEGVIDIADTSINGIEGNLVLEADEIPVRGDIDG